MKIAIINMTGGGMSGGYRKYLGNIIPRMASNPAVEALLCASPESLNVRSWLKQLPNVQFVNCKAFQFLPPIHDSELHRHLEEYAPGVIFVPVERHFCFNDVPIVNMIQNMEPFICPNKGNPVSEILRNCEI